MTNRPGASVNVPTRYRDVNTTVYGPVLRTHLLGRTRASLGIMVNLYIKRSDLFCGCSSTCIAALMAGSHIANGGPATTLCATSSCCQGGFFKKGWGALAGDVWGERTTRQCTTSPFCGVLFRSHCGPPLGTSYLIARICSRLCRLPPVKDGN